MHTSVYDASPPRGSDSSSVQTHHGAASATQSPAGAAAHMEKGGASERTPAARELGTGELGTARVVLASDTSRKSKTTMNGMTIVNSGSHHDTASAAEMCLFIRRINAQGEARIDGSSQSVSEARPEIDPFRTKNVD